MFPFVLQVDEYQLNLKIQFGNMHEHYLITAIFPLQDFISMLRGLQNKVTQYMGLHMHQIVNTAEWNRCLSPDRQRKLLDGRILF